MATPKEIIPHECNRDIVATEADRLFNSAKLRIEQQRIHIQELAGNLAERTRARRQLKAMIERCKKLRTTSKRTD